MCRYQTGFWLAPRSVPVQYSSTVIIQLGSTKRRYVEKITFQVCENLTLPQCHTCPKKTEYIKDWTFMCFRKFAKND